jgi:hypothetical protein
MQEFIRKLEEARALCKLELAQTDDPEAVRTMRFAIAEIEEIIRLAASEAARTPWGEGRAASL